uniref:Uncharacterized protein n=1 Tax=Physcomitrium patens TaxID=3218 RepID=A0A2K1JXZ2_PHYPA|nr:hypothetical protein PHYPA_013517 [Physcomitrium patens]
MAKESMPTDFLNSQFLAAAWPYILLIVVAVLSLQFLRLAVSYVFSALRLLVRIVLLVISWPIYLILLPARVLVFFTRMAIRILFYATMAAILYSLLGGVLNSTVMKEAFGEALQYLQSTFLQQ